MTICRNCFMEIERDDEWWMSNLDVYECERMGMAISGDDEPYYDRCPGTPDSPWPTFGSNPGHNKLPEHVPLDELSQLCYELLVSRTKETEQ